MFIFDRTGYDYCYGLQSSFFLLRSHSGSEHQTQKGEHITMIAILITAYLVIGALVSALIWIILIASQRHESKAKKVNRGGVESNLFHEPNAN